MSAVGVGHALTSRKCDLLRVLCRRAHGHHVLPQWRLCSAGTGAAGAAAGWRRARRDESARDLWGCFEFTTDSSDWLMRVVEAGTNLRTRIAGASRPRFSSA